ncbi:MAG TPA: PD-(D/E)XK nuclease family protein [Polyangiaceae bacterium]
MNLDRQTPSELVLVASERQAEREAARGTRVLTLRELATRLLEAAAPEQREASLETTRLLARRTLRGQPAALALAVDDALGQLRRAGAHPADVARAGGARGALLGDALQRTNQRLSELGLRDERENAWLAARALSTVSVRELDGVERARVRGVSHWENGDLALVEALHRKLRTSTGGGVVVELPTVRTDLGDGLRDAVARIAARFEQRWASDNDPPELEFADARPGGAAPTVIQAAHEASEARVVARSVLDALARGAALDRIAIVPVDAADAFLEPLRAELAAARLPFSEAWSRSASSAPEAHAALELIRLAQGPVLRDALVDVLRAPDLELSALLDAKPQLNFVAAIARLPVRVDRAGELLSAIETRRRRLEPGDERTREALDVAHQVLSALFARFERLRVVSTRRVFRERWRELFSELGLLSTSRRGLTQAIRYAERSDQAPLGALGQNARAGRAIDMALERVVTAAELLGLADETLELADFSQEFATALASVGPSQGAGRAGTLRVARAAEVAGLDWDLLIVCRAASSTLDWQSSSSDGVLDADLIDQLPAHSRPPTAADRGLFARLALAGSMSCAEHSVVTWAARDARGGSGASRLVMNLSPSETLVEPASPLDRKARRVVPLPAASAEVRMRADLELRRQDFYSNPESPLGFENGRAGPLERWVGGDAERPLALTQLERYARCAFLGFSGVVLRAVRDDAVGDGLSARERGTLIHEALAVALTGTREYFGTREPAELERDALTRAEAFLRAQVSSKLRGAALTAAMEDVAALLRWSFANSDGVWFAEAERAFGNNQEWTALPVGAHFVSGRIDRIDRNSDGSVVRIIDYKTGSVRLTGEHGDQLLQPWLYAKKVAEHYHASRVSSGYLSLQRRKPEWKAALEESEPSTSAISDKLRRAEELLLGLRSGRVPAKPALPGSCEHCDARDICRRPLSAPHEAGE